MSIAERRHHEQRIKAKFLRSTQYSDHEWLAKEAGRFANHGKACSCPTCGNPRRHFGERTIQEIKAGWPEGARRILEREYT